MIQVHFDKQADLWWDKMQASVIIGLDLLQVITFGYQINQNNNAKKSGKTKPCRQTHKTP